MSAPAAEPNLHKDEVTGEMVSKSYVRQTQWHIKKHDRRGVD